MSILRQLDTLIVQAMKEKNTIWKNTLRDLKAEIIKQSQTKGNVHTLTYDEELNVINRLINQRYETITFVKDKVKINELTMEISYLKLLLPPQIDEKEATQKIIAVMKNANLEYTMKNMGTFVKLAKNELNGTFDNSKIALIVKQIINNGGTN